MARNVIPWTAAGGRPNPRARSPLFVWHQVFWNLDEKTIGTNRFLWVDRVNSYTEELWSRLSRNPTTNFFSGLKSPYRQQNPWKLTPDDPLAHFEFNWYFFKIILRLELHTEYITICTFFDLSINDKAANRFDQILANSKLGRFYAGISKLRRFLQQHNQIKTEYSKFSQCADSVYLNAVDEFRKLLFPSEADKSALGSDIADFRALVLGQVPDRDNEVAICKPFWRDVEVPSSPTKKDDNDEGDWQLQTKAMWDFAISPVGGKDFRDFEFTVSLLSDSRALYISALGAQPDTAERSSNPLLYSLYTKELGGWATAGLLERINRQGTLRVAALYGVDELRKATPNIRAAEEIVRNALAADVQNRTELLNKAQREIGIANDKVLGGVEYRIERTRYYINQFNSGIKGLDIKAMGDYQPYDLFVENKFGSSFQFVEMLGARYDRVQRDMRSVNEQILAQSAKNENHSIQRIQAFGEVALLFALLPYYVGNLLFHALTWKSDPGKSAEAPHALWWLTFALGAWLAVSRWEPIPGSSVKSYQSWAIPFLGFASVYNAHFVIAALAHQTYEQPLPALLLEGFTAAMGAGLILGGRPARETGFVLLGLVTAAMMLSFCGTPDNPTGAFLNLFALASHVTPGR